MPSLQYSKEYNGTIIRIKFLSLPRKGYFQTYVKPAVDLLKAAVPATLRSYNGVDYTWDVAVEFWPPLLNAFQTGLGYKATETISATVDPLNGTTVPKDYADNFHYTPPAPVKESAVSIAAQLSKYLGVEITTQDIKELKTIYRARAREFHPDLNPAPEATQKMSELNRLWTLYTAGGTN